MNKKMMVLIGGMMFLGAQACAMRNITRFENEAKRMKMGVVETAKGVKDDLKKCGAGEEDRQEVDQWKDDSFAQIQKFVNDRLDDLGDKTTAVLVKKMNSRDSGSKKLSAVRTLMNSKMKDYITWKKVFRAGLKPSINGVDRKVRPFAVDLVELVKGDDTMKRYMVRVLNKWKFPKGQPSSHKEKKRNELLHVLGLLETVRR